MAKIKRHCKHCGKEFLAAYKEVNRGNAKFCSLGCAATYGNNQRKYLLKTANCLCNFCGKEFYRKPSAIKTKVVYCSQKCFYEATHPLYTSKTLLTIVQDFYKKNGRIPLHEEFNSNPAYPNPGTYIVAFGSWNKAIEKSGFCSNRASFGSRCVASDGHRCRSFAEKTIDDWLTECFIEHEKEVYYPQSLRRVDWRAGNVYIEYLGLAMDYNHPLNWDYRKSLAEKRKLSKKYGLTLIELYPEDLKNLETKLCVHSAR